MHYLLRYMCSPTKGSSRLTTHTSSLECSVSLSSYLERFRPANLYDWFPGRSVPETLGATRRDDATTGMDDAASHIGDVATHANDDTNQTDEAHDHVDDMEMAETTSTDDELESAWTEDSDDSAEEDP